MNDCMKEIPEVLRLAQEFQKAHDYGISRKLYNEFFITHPNHCLRFKALFEVADNWYYERNYEEALKAYNVFINYCNSIDKKSPEELGWTEAYLKLAYSRMKSINKK